MGEQENANRLEITPEWLLRQVPVVSFFCENDPQYTMRLLIGGSGTAFGYDLDEFIDNRSYYAASAPHPDDLDILDAHAEFAIKHTSPAVSRIRLIQADSAEVPIVLVSRAVRDAQGEPVGLAGIALDLTLVPQLQGERGLLSEPAENFMPRPRVEKVDYRSADWLVHQLPVFTYFVEDDEDYTPRFQGGSLEEMLGYRGEEFLNARTYKAPSAIYPPDQHFGDAHVTAAAQEIGAISAVRERLVHKDGHEVPVLSFARGAKPSGGVVGAAGIVLDVSNVPGLQGNPGLLVP